MCRSRNAQEHILSVALESFQCTGELVTPQSEVETDVELLGGLPFASVINVGKDGSAVSEGRCRTEYVVYEGRAVVEHSEGK